jgi:hypothetical protein
VQLQFEFEYTGDGQRRETEYSGTFVKVVEAPVDRTPTIGEAIHHWGRFVTRVRWVLWRLDGQPPEVHLEVQPGYESSVPSRAELAAAGWNEA